MTNSQAILRSRVRVSVQCSLDYLRNKSINQWIREKSGGWNNIWRSSLITKACLAPSFLKVLISGSGSTHLFAKESGGGGIGEGNCTRTLETKRRSNDERHFRAPISLSYVKPWFDNCSILPHQRQMEPREGGLTVRLYYNKRRKDKECSNFHKGRFESNRFIMMLITSLYQPCNEWAATWWRDQGRTGQLGTYDALNNFYYLLKITFTI